MSPALASLLYRIAAFTLPGRSRRHPLSHALLFVLGLLAFALPGRLAAQATNRWTGSGDGTSWGQAANWDLDRAPGPTDVVIIDRDGTNTVVRLTDTRAVVRTLTATATLELTTSELLVDRGLSQLSGPLKLAFSAFTASGNGTRLVATNTATLEGSSLVASGGAIVRLTGLRRFVSGDRGNVYLLAQQSGSAVELPSLTELEGSTGRFQFLAVQANQGGRIQLGSVPVIEVGYTSFSADQLGSLIDLAALTRITGNELNVQRGGQLLTPALRQLDRTVVNLSGADSLLDLSQVESIPGSTFRVSAGAQVEILGVSDLSGGEAGATLAVSGAGSVLDFPAVTLIAGATGRFSQYNLQALNGGALRFPSLTQVTGGSSQFYADGPGSIVDLPSLPELTFNGLEARNGATLECPALTRVRNASLIVRGTTTRLPVAQINNADGSSLQALEGATVRFSGLTIYDALDLGNVSLISSGAGSQLDFPSLTSVRGAKARFASLFVQAGTGGQISFPQLTQVTEGVVSFLADGEGSRLDLPVVTTLEGPALEARSGGSFALPLLRTFRFGPLIVRGPTSVLPVTQITQLDGASVLAAAGAVLRFSGISSYDALDNGNASLSAFDAGSRLEFPQLTSLTGTVTRFATLTVQATGGAQLLLPKLTQVAVPSIRFLAGGVGGRLELPLLSNLTGTVLEARDGGYLVSPALTVLQFTTFAASGTGSRLDTAQIQRTRGASLYAENGAQLTFDSLRTFEGGDASNVSIQATGVGARLEFPVLTELQGTTARFSVADLRAVNGGVVQLPQVRVLEAGSLQLSATGPGARLELPQFVRGLGLNVELADGAQLLSPQWSELHSGRLAVGGTATVDTSRLAIVDGSSLVAFSGGQLRLPAVRSYRAGSGSAQFQSSGPGSRLELPVVTEVVGPTLGFANLSIQADNGGVLRLPAVTRLDEGPISLSAGGPNSELQLPALVRLQNVPISVSASGTLATPALTSLTGGSVTLNHPSFWTTESVRSLRNLPVTVFGATVAFPQLTDAGTATFTLRDGATTVLPPAADLQITAIGLPTTGRAGHPLSVTWSVTNASDVATSGLRQDRFALRRPGAPDLDLGLVEVPGDLAARSTRQHQVTLILPSDLTGTWRLVVTVDGGFTVFEGNQEANNVRVSDGVVGLATPDLVVTDVGLPVGPLVAGVPFELTWVVQNTGTTNATAAWHDALLFGTNATDFTAATFLGSHPRPQSLAAGASYTNQVQVVLPLQPSLAPGAWFLAVVANSDHAQPEVTEDNNVRTRPVTLTWPPLPDLIPIRVVGPTPIRPGSSVPISYAVANQGVAPAVGPWTEVVYLQYADSPTDRSHPLGVFRGEGFIAPNSAQDHSRTVTLPADLRVAADARWLVVVNPDPTLVESSTANNEALGNTPVQVAASLTLELAQTEILENAAPLIGRLQRNGSLASPLTVQLASLPAGRLGGPATVVFPAGQAELTVSFQVLPDGLVTPPQPVQLTARAAGFTDGTATVTVENVDPALLTLQFAAGQVRQGQSIAATVTRNAGVGTPLVLHFTSSLPGRLLPPADLTLNANQTSALVAWVALDDDLLLPDETVTASVGAPGFAAASATLLVVEPALPELTLTVSRATLKESDGPLAGLATVTRSGRLNGSLLVALSSTNTNAVVVPASVTIPAGTNQATFFLAAVPRPTLAEDQRTELRAFATYTLTGEPVGPPARLGVTVLDTDRPALALTLSRAVVPPGRTPATTGTVRRPTASPTPLTVNLGQSVAGLLVLPPSVVIPANADAVEFPVNTAPDPTGSAPRTTRLTATAPGLVPAEAELTVSGQNLPDLVVEAVTGPPDALTLANASLSWRVRNQGLVDFSGRVRQRVYLSADGQLDPEDPLVADQSVEGQFLIGAFLGVARTIFLPARPGDYWVFVQLDPEGDLTEISDRNNLGRSAQPIRVRPAYSVTALELTPASGPAGEPVEFRGRLLRPDGTPAAFEVAALYVRRDGSERPIAGFANENGDFVATFRPGRSEAGVFAVAADHPEVLAPPNRLQFVRFALVADPAAPAVTVVAGGQRTLRLTVTNPGPTPLTGLQTSGVGLPSGASLVALLPAVLPAGGSIAVDVEVVAGTAALGQTTASLRLTSTEGARLEVPLALRIVPPVPQLQLTPEFLVAGVVRGQSARLRLAVTNSGALPSGPLTVVLPDVPWLSDTTAGARPSLAPGEGTTFDLAFHSTPDQALGEYQGEVLVVAAGFQTRVPFSIRLVSTAVGDLEVLAEDEYTYYAAGAPKLAGARVEVLDPYTAAVLATATTDAAGLARLTGLAEGPYRLRVSAVRHATREVPVTIQPGLTQRTRVLVPVEGVAYSWNVEATDVPDRYRVTLESQFETTVPFPLVTAVEPKVFPLVFPGEVTTMNITFTNHGLLAARGLQVNARSSSTYRITPLFKDLGDLPAHSSISVPVRVEFQPELDERIVAGLLQAGRPVGNPNQPALLRTPRRPGAALAADAGGGGGNDCDAPSLDALYFVVCGDDGLYHVVGLDITPIGMLRDLVKCLQALAKGPSNAGGAACDCASQAVAGIGAALGGPSELPKPLKCLVAVLCQDVGEIAKCICPGIEPGDSYYGTGGGIGGGGQFVPPPGGAGRCTIIPTGASLAASTGLATTLQVASDGQPRALVIAAHPKAATSPVLATVPSSNSLTVERRGEASPAAGDDGICAQVRLRLTQDVALTRAGFRAVLGLENRLPATPLTDVGFQLHFYDAAGRVADDRFGVRAPLLTGVTALDGTGLVAAGATGTAEFLIVPSPEAAPTGPTPYTVGGELRYFDGTQAVVIPLEPTPLSVLPQPELSLDYYHQRDVFSDDPFTPELEPSEPFTLGLLVRNTGAGTARNVSLRSGQPQIVENEKGLLIDFQVVATEVFTPDGQRTLTPSLAADFGELAPGAVQAARWLLKSTLQGLFLDYTAEVEHVDPLGGVRFAAIAPERVRIHELTHLVRDPRAGADALPDFLVNEDPGTDPDDLPDSVHLSTGAVEPVHVLQTAIPDAAPANQRREVLLTVAAPTGWTYLRIPDPQGTTGPRRFRLISVRRPDGSALPDANFWQTDRTFLGLGRRPLQEHRLHLFDLAAPGQYRLVYEPVAPTDSQAPVATLEPLPAASFPEFPLRWNGTDNTPGALLFDVFASVDDGPFSPWRLATPLSGGQYLGETGHRYAFYVVATDPAGNRSLVPAAPQATTVTLLENRAPVLDAVPTQTLFAGNLLELRLTAEDPDGFLQTLRYSVEPGGPPGVTVDPATGVLSWATPRGLGGTTQRLTVSVRDDGEPALADQVAFDVHLIASNSPPVLAPLRNLTVVAGNLATFRATATDLDLPIQTLRFRFVGPVPEGATLDPISGVFRWQPAEFANASVNPITVEVTDNGSPVQSDRQTFTVVVRKRASDFRLALGNAVVNAGQSGALTLRLVAGQPLSQVAFQLPATGPALVDLSLEPLAAGLSGAQLQPLPDGTYTATFFTEPGTLLDGDLDLARIAFGTRPLISDLALVSPREVRGLDATGALPLRGIANTGRVVVIGAEPVLDAAVPGQFTLYGLPGQTYRVETRARLAPETLWVPGAQLTLEGQSLAVPLPPDQDQGFLRVRTP